MRSRWMVAVIGAMAVVAACSGGGGAEESAADPEGVADEEAGTWTVLHYAIADTDLEPFLLADLEELAAVAGGDLGVVALVDRADGYVDGDALGLGDWTGGVVLELDETGVVVTEELGDVNTGDPALLAEFIVAGVAAKPADNYALVLSDHGAAWPGIGGDESADHDTLTLDELDDALTQGLDAAGIDSLGLLGFDACLMATYEVASILAPHADRLLASQELEPGHGWDYAAFGVAAEGPVTVDDLGGALLGGFEAQARAEGTAEEITLSLVDLTAMGAVDAALADFSETLLAEGSDVAPVVGRSLVSELSFGRSSDPFQASHMTDLGGFAAAVGAGDEALADVAAELTDALDAAVLGSVAGRVTQAASGLSIYFPAQAAWYDDAYAEVGGVWSDVLEHHYAAGRAIPDDEAARFVEGDAEVFFDEDGLNITALFDLAVEHNLSEATIRYGLVEDDGSVTYLGDEPAVIADDGSGTVIGIYDLTVLTMSDGIDEAYAYLDMTYDEEQDLITIDVPLGYRAPGADGEVYDDVLLSLVLDGERGDVLSETYYLYQPELETYGEATLDPEGLIFPLLPNILDDGTEEWFPTSDVGLYAELPSLAYDLESLASGSQLHVELVVTDFGGNWDSVSAVVAVP